MKKFCNLLILFILSMAILTGCSSNQELTKSTYPSPDSLSTEQKQLLPYYNNGWTLMYQKGYKNSGSMKVYYLGKNVGEVPCDLSLEGVEYWTSASPQEYYPMNDRTVYTQTVRLNESKPSKKLVQYNLDNKEYKLIADMDVLSKYGIYRKTISNGYQLYMLFEAADWTNVVLINNDGTEELLSKIPYSGGINATRTIEAWLGQPDGTFNAIAGGDLYNINLTDGEFKLINSVPLEQSKEGEPHTNRYYESSVPAFRFLPNNKFIYLSRVEEVDPINGFSTIYCSVDEYDLVSKEFKQIGKFEMAQFKARVISVTDKYVVLRTPDTRKGVSGESAYIMSLETGEGKYLSEFIGYTAGGEQYDLCYPYINKIRTFFK